ncbi:MAG: LysR family transcriptional regulator [Pseudomonadota bacterium]
MNITTIRTFLAVVDSGNLNKAADRLNVTQSTVTARLDSLEAALGQTLLVRSRRGTQLTRAGFAFRPHAEALVRGWDQAQSAVGLPKGFSGLFSFACEFDLWAGAGKQWFDDARKAHTDLAFEAWPAALDEIKSWLASGLTDAALTTEPVAGPQLKSRDYLRERIVQVATVPRRVMDWDPRYIYVDLGSEFRRQHAEVWSNDRTASVSYAASRWALDHLLLEGGSAYLPKSVCKHHLERRELHLVEGSPEFSRALSLVWRERTDGAFPWLSADH